MSTESEPTTKAAQSEATAPSCWPPHARCSASGVRRRRDRGGRPRAGVTRGALYHQFADKRDLFRAVFEQVEGELIAAAAKHEADHPDDMVAAFKAACRGWLHACAMPEAEQIVLLDAPRRPGLGDLARDRRAPRPRRRDRLARVGHGDRALVRQPVRPLAHMLVGALDEAALYIARAEDREQALAEADAIVDRLVDGLAA